jgi:hypothetical protein
MKSTCTYTRAQSLGIDGLRLSDGGSGEGPARPGSKMHQQCEGSR